MGLILIVGTFISTLHFLLIAVFLIVVYCMIVGKITKNKAYIPYKLLSFFGAAVCGYLMLSWFYFLKYVSTYNVPGAESNLSLVSMVFDLVGLLIIGLYPNVVEKLSHQKIIHICVYIIAILMIIL